MITCPGKYTKENMFIVNNLLLVLVQPWYQKLQRVNLYQYKIFSRYYPETSLFSSHGSSMCMSMYSTIYLSILATCLFRQCTAEIDCGSYLISKLSHLAHRNDNLVISMMFLTARPCGFDVVQHTSRRFVPYSILGA